MVGKARSSNFTLSEKLDLLSLVKPYVKILEEHTNKNSVIVEKNRCWDVIAVNYNAIGVDRPPRTAQGLRSLYKRLKEYAKQELLQQKEAQSDFKSNISEPTKKVMEMIPQISSFCLIRDRNHTQSASLDEAAQAGTSSLQVMVDHHPVAITVEVKQEEDIKSSPPLLPNPQHNDALEQREEHELVHVLEEPLSPSLSSVDMRMTSSPSSVPRRDDLFHRESGEHIRSLLRYDPQVLQMLKEEHQIILENQKNFGLYVQEKRDGLRRRQQLEEELLRAKIEVEKLKASRLRHNLPEFHSASEEIIESKAQDEEPSSLLKYFSVVWCKASKKKHKKWEGDAILIVKGRSFTLKDLEGKDIGRGVGYKFRELENIEEGQTLVVGGKEVEILGPVSSDDFRSGKCFQHGCGSPSAPSSQAARQCFSNPFKSVCQSGQSKENRRNDWQTCKPRHDPHTPNSLVMPQPDQNHQRLFNRNCSPLVDVVVDPHLVRHLRSHQRDGVIFLYECVMGMRAHGRCGAILADEMGLGKTLQCISLIWTLQCQGPYGGKPVIKKTLIVTPGSLVTNWRKEFQKWLGSERIKIFTVDQDHKVEEFINSTFYSVLVISYEMLLRSLDLIKTVRFDLLICDEGHRLKNSSIKTAAALFSLPCEKRVILTGTPVQNDLQEFFALVDFVNPGILGSLSSYRKIYEEPIVMSREPSSSKEEKELGERRAAELTCLTGLFILRRTQEVINKYLPPKIESVVFCRPGALQVELYQELLSSQSVRFCLQGLSENHLVCIGALKKLCNHPCLLFRPVKGKECSASSEENEERNLCQGLLTVFPAGYDPLQCSENESGKLQVLVKLLAAIHELRPTEKVVLVSNYRQTLNILEDVCKRHGYACARLDGQTPVSQRQQIVDSFNSKYSTDFIFLLSSKAGGVGLNLIGGSHLILYDIDWNPATDIQAMSRVWRDGQKHPVHIYRLLTTGTIEEKIYQRQISKQGLSGAVVDLTRSSEHIQFSVEELKDLFTLHEDSPCVTHDLLGCECAGGKDPTGDTLDAPVTSRQCQLGPQHQKSRSLRPLSMSQLKQWQHFSGDHLNLTDPFLERIRGNASFFFQNITNQAPAVQ